MVADGGTCNKLFVKNPYKYWILGINWGALKSGLGRLSFRHLIKYYLSTICF